MTFEEVFTEIDKTKEKYRISNLLSGLSTLEPDIRFIDKIKKLTTHRASEIRWGALGLLSNYNSPTLEEFFIELLKSDSDNITITKSIQGLGFNGTEKSIDILIDTFKKSRDGQVRGTIVSTLRSIYLRNILSDNCKTKLFSFIGNSYPFFQGFWNDIKKAKNTTKTDWQENAFGQLSSNGLNLKFEQSDEIDIHINIEKMNSHFIRYINVTAIYKKQKSSFSKYYTPSEFYLSENRLFDSLFDKTKVMRPDIYRDKIIKILDIEILPILIDKIKLWSSLKTMTFTEFETNQTSIFNTLYGTNWDWVIAQLLTQSINMFDENAERNKYIDFVIQKWKICDKETFQVKSYLEEQKKAGNMGFYASRA